MRYSSTSPRSRWSSLLNQSSLFLASASLAVSTIAAMVPSAIAYAEPSVKPQASSSLSSSLPDGTYLYGQSAQAEQIGQGYFVFEVNRGKVMGALYMPRSSFDCAAGSFKDDQLALTVVNSYDHTTNPFEIALERSGTVATTGNPAQQEVDLQGFHQISTLSQNDQRMLSVCKADLQKQSQR